MARSKPITSEGWESLHIWCETTPPDDEYAECIAGYCSKCGVERNQTESGFLFWALAVTLHDEEGAFEYAPVGKQLFSNSLCCAVCGTSLGAKPRRRKRHE